MQCRVVIAGTNSGVGKTTITIGIMAALKKRGYVVQGFKCGPDYIDPKFHTAITGRKSRNLDSWMLHKDIVHDIFIDASIGADISIIEGMMGLYDGRSPDCNEGSTAEISVLLEAPVILIVDISSIARSAAAIVKGYQMFDPAVKIGGVILNQAGSVGHYEICKLAIEQECDIPVLGYILKDDVLKIRERNLGLVPAIERGELNTFFETVSSIMEKQIDLDKLLAISIQPSLKKKTSLFTKKEEECVTIAVAYDEAFNFYYEENLKMLQLHGARLKYFRPLRGEAIPDDVDGLYIGGGFPDEYLETLTSFRKNNSKLKTLIENGLPVFAECGGFMFLCESITTVNGETFPMVGIIPGKIRMMPTLQAIGYREVTALYDSVILKAKEKAFGHEFHYSIFEELQPMNKVYHSKGLRKEGYEGFHLDNVTAGFTHIHFASNQNIPKRFIQVCKKYQSSKGAKK